MTQDLITMLEGPILQVYCKYIVEILRIKDISSEDRRNKGVKLVY